MIINDESESEIEDYEEYDYQNEELVDNQYDQESFDLNDNSDELEDFANDFMNDLPQIGNDEYDYIEEFDEYYEYEQAQEFYETEEA